MRNQDPAVQDPWYLKFSDLMVHRVREILLVSTPYDAFTLEADGRLTERVFTAYHELNLTAAPRISHAPTAARAMELLSQRRFDLVLTMARIADTDVAGFGRMVKARFPSLPVVLLVLNEGDINRFPSGATKFIDHVFWWTGDARILLAIVKLVEDALNAPYDVEKAGVRVIVVVEDSIRRYSAFLSLLYAELMIQSNSLSLEGVNELHRLARIRARPKLLLARTYEEATELLARYQSNLFALITDVRFPKNGEEHPQAGFELVREVQAQKPGLPVLVQSAEPANRTVAAELGVHYADKSSATLLKDIRLFVTESLGFGDFVFRLPDRTEVYRARDMIELEQALRTVPVESVCFHAMGNHFSLWMMARAMFTLADEVRLRRLSDFENGEAMREYLLHVLEEFRVKQQEGVVTDLNSKYSVRGAHFIRVGMGSLGGKARGLAFVSSVLARGRFRDRVPGLEIRIPHSVVVATDEFERFLENNRLGGEIRTLSGVELRRRFLAGQLSPEIRADLWRAMQHMSGPLAVRSSSLLEDSQLQPFAGIYATYMLPNNDPDPEVRFRELVQAVKAVWASTYSDDAKAYMACTPYSLEEERMAVLIQEVVGRTHGERYYPHAAGVALSYNYYPVGAQKPTDGLVTIALGLGQTVVDGGTTVQFSPAQPEVLPQFGSARDYLAYSQKKFYALDLSRTRVDFSTGDDVSSLVSCTLAQAEADGTLALAASVYCREDDTIRPGLSTPGTRVVSFHNLLRYESIPLAAALRTLLEVFREGMGSAVEIEFALEAGDWGRSQKRGHPAARPVLYVLQVRPQADQNFETEVETEGFAEADVVCTSDRSMGHGRLSNIADIVLVERSDLEATDTPGIAQQVGQINTALMTEKRPYLLIGPGRWGSSDRRLGIPVTWSQIAGAKVIVETDFDNREVEPSQGAHFFHNVTCFRVGYLTLSNLDHRGTWQRRRLDRAWLDTLPVHAQLPGVRHLRLETPLSVLLDGRSGTATILKPGVPVLPERR